MNVFEYHSVNKDLFQRQFKQHRSCEESSYVRKSVMGKNIKITRKNIKQLTYGSCSY